MKKISYSGRRFLPEIIQQTIWLYLRFTPSFRDVGDLLTERDIAVSYETIRRGVSHFGPMIAADLRKRRPKPPFRGRRERGRTYSGEAADPADTTRQRRHGEGVSRHEAPRLRVLRSADLRHRGAGSRRLPGARAVDANHVEKGRGKIPRPLPRSWIARGASWSSAFNFSPARRLQAPPGPPSKPAWPSRRTARRR